MIDVEALRPTSQGIPTSRPRRTQAWLRAMGWTLIVLSVQPWTFEDPGHSLAKGIVLSVGVALAALTGRAIFQWHLSRPQVLYLVYAAVMLISAVYSETPGASSQRVARLALTVLAVSVLWRPFGSMPDRLLGYHLSAYGVLTLVVVLGLATDSQSAFQGPLTEWQGPRLHGHMLGLKPPRVGEIGGILAGLSILALVYRRLDGRLMSCTAGAGVALILLSHTRTAAVALVGALLLATIATFRAAAARRAFVIMTILLAAGAVVFGTGIADWVLRDQSSSELLSLTDRSTAWAEVARAETTSKETWIGRGLGAKAIAIDEGHARSIDNGWLTTYHEAGLVGVALVSAAVLWTLVLALRSRTMWIKASTLFLTGYVLIASISETGLSDASTHLLALMVASTAAAGDRTRVERYRRAEGLS